MNDSSRKISPLRQRMNEEMRLRQLAPKTRDTYIRAVLHFTGFLGRSPDTATAEDLRRYQLHCVDHGAGAGAGSRVCGYCAREITSKPPPGDLLPPVPSLHWATTKNSQAVHPDGSIWLDT